MAKRDTYSYRAELERAKAQRRYAAYKQIAANKNISAEAREDARQSMRELRSAMTATRQRTKSGRIIKSRTEEGLDAALERLQQLNAAGEIYIGRSGQSNAVTQSEINKASVDAPSTYTKEEVKLFYRATQKAWQREGVTLHNRNEAILRYYGRRNLAELMREVLGKNKQALEAGEINPEEELTEEQSELYGNEEDVNDNEGSPTVENILQTWLSALHSKVIEPTKSE